MDIAWGQTRFVILLGDCAIKVGRIRPFRFLFRIPLILVSDSRRNHFFKKYGTSFVLAMMRDIFAGIIANRKEYAYSRCHDDARVMPTRKQYLGGLIIIQDRGTRISPGELLQEHPLRDSLFWHKAKALESHQFCRNFDNRVVLVDYGNEETVQFLLETVI